MEITGLVFLLNVILKLEKNCSLITGKEMSITSASRIQRKVKSLKPVLGHFLGKKN